MPLAVAMASRPGPSTATPIGSARRPSAPRRTPLRPGVPTTVLTTPQMQTMLELTQFVEKTYCQNKPGYYSGSCDQALYDRHKPKSLDMELKFHKNGQFLLKQVREFAGK